MLVLPTIDDTGSLGYPPHRVVYPTSVSILVTASRFLAGNSEDELKPTISSALTLLYVFQSFFFS